MSEGGRGNGAARRFADVGRRLFLRTRPGRQYLRTVLWARLLLLQDGRTTRRRLDTAIALRHRLVVLGTVRGRRQHCRVLGRRHGRQWFHSACRSRGP